jgi:hypothetical protein
MSAKEKAAGLVHQDNSSNSNSYSMQSTTTNININSSNSSNGNNHSNSNSIPPSLNGGFPVFGNKRLAAINLANPSTEDPDIHYKVFTNDGSDESNIALIALKNIFARQLPKMPKVDTSPITHFEPTHFCSSLVVCPSYKSSPLTLAHFFFIPFEHIFLFYFLISSIYFSNFQEYIVRLVFDKRHLSIAIMKKTKIIGGICYRP